MNTTFPLSGKTFCLHSSSHSGKLYPVSGKTFPHMNKTKLFDLSKCFLGNRDNFCPYKQALSVPIRKGVCINDMHHSCFTYLFVVSVIHKRVCINDIIILYFTHLFVVSVIHKGVCTNDMHYSMFDVSICCKRDT